MTKATNPLFIAKGVVTNTFPHATSSCTTATTGHTLRTVRVSVCVCVRVCVMLATGSEPGT